MISLGLLGAGRIGQTHATALLGREDARLAAVHDPDTKAAESVARRTGARVTGVEEILADATVDAVLICTPTDLHAAQAEQAAAAGKAIFCEKPIDLDLARARLCAERVRPAGVPFMLGFQRRFDPHFADLRARLRAGAIGDAELVQITSRDPVPPPLAYIQRSGGLFKDMMIHDLDMARFLLGQELQVVSATGAALTDPTIGAAGDIDTAVVTLRAAGGALVVISNSRRALYGYDQRVEVHGARGLLAVENVPTTAVLAAGAEGMTRQPHQPFFMQRYAEAYRAEIDAFLALIRGDDVAVPGLDDGLAALELAESCQSRARDLRAKTGQ
ncbi:MAG: inositol 2-dehydrogenase [Pseudomonadota bacterium]